MGLSGSASVQWRKSARCESSSCVEVADLGTRAGLRNSTDPAVELAFELPVWQAFIAGVRAGEFDRPS